MSEVITMDGRQAKREGNRRRMLLAAVKLIERGHYRFTAKDVTDRIGMHRRSFFENYETMDNFIDELLAVHEATIQAAIAKQVREDGKSLARLVLLGS